MAEVWQEIDEQCQVCHSWQELVESMITAMTELLIFWTVVIVLAALMATLRDLYDDGYDRRPPPSSHLPDASDPRNRIRPV